MGRDRTPEREELMAKNFLPLHIINSANSKILVQTIFLQNMLNFRENDPLSD
jgi:hypothetical protein